MNKKVLGPSYLMSGSYQKHSDLKKETSTGENKQNAFC